MPDGTALTPLRPREFFAVPWSGEGEWIARGWVRWLPGRAHRFRFSSYTTWLNDEVWLVHETTTWEDGRFERRDGVGRLVAPDRIRFTYDDMPGGTELQLRADGFSFTPYQMLVPVPPLPIPVLIRARDDCRWDATKGELTDTIEIRLLGIPIGRQVMRLRPENARRSGTNF
jgi:hypothetical protein